MAKPPFIELPTGERIDILYEDRSVLAIDKPAGWMLAPDEWQRTSRNLQAALRSSLEARDFWASSRNLKFLRFIHRLDAETTGVLLLGKNPGVISALSQLFETHQVTKAYLAVVLGIPKRPKWVCDENLDAVPGILGKMRTVTRGGKPSVTEFKVLETRGNRTLLEAHPLSGRTHQIRVHLQASGHPVVGDSLYGPPGDTQLPLALRAILVEYEDPFSRRAVRIRASTTEFLKQFGFETRPAPPGAQTEAQQ